MLETRLTKTKFQYGVIYSTQILVPMRLHPHMSLGTGLRSKDSLVASQFGSYMKEGYIPTLTIYLMLQLIVTTYTDLVSQARLSHGENLAHETDTDQRAGQGYVVFVCTFSTACMCGHLLAIVHQDVVHGRLILPGLSTLHFYDQKLDSGKAWDH